MNAAMMLQYWQGFGCTQHVQRISTEGTTKRLEVDGNKNKKSLTVPNCFTFWAHFLQIVFVLLWRERNKVTVRFQREYCTVQQIRGGVET